MTQLTLRRVTMELGPMGPLFQDVSLCLEPGFYGLVGANGAGKSTFLRVLAGQDRPSEGQVLLTPPKARVSLFPQLPSLQVSRSPGETQRLQLEPFFYDPPDVLLLDEPTNHLDAETRAWLLSALRRFRGIAVIVSHDRTILEELPTTLLRIHDRTVTAWPGPYSAAQRAWEGQRAQELKAYAAAQARVRKAEAQLADSRRTRDAADQGRRTSARIKGPRDHDGRSVGAKNLAAWAEDREGRHVATRKSALARAQALVPTIARDPTLGGRVFPAFERSRSPIVLRLHEDEIRAHGRPVLHDVHLDVGRADRLRIQGPNGAGKSTLLRALIAPRRDLVESGAIFYLPQELTPGAIEELTTHLHGLDTALRGQVLAIVGTLGSDPERFVARSIEARARLSPGEARKLALAMALGRSAQALVLDEPTNHMDLPTVERLEEALAAYPGALVLVTHDEALARRLTTRTVKVQTGQVNH